ncbi:uncharacterized protein PG998_013225 [Apiospora kogelbergensis]|uniref:uncharacterized protein n=1 Tax=Apiospora kogelbergensis TaxID=1337665 RepID=UPI003130CB79
MDPLTKFDTWDLSLPISSTKARRRREEIVRLCARVDPGWEGKIKMVVTAEHNVCRFLWELHHHGKMPEDRFCWLVDQVIFRYTETRLRAQPGAAPSTSPCCWPSWATCRPCASTTRSRSTAALGRRWSDSTASFLATAPTCFPSALRDKTLIIRIFARDESQYVYLVLRDKTLVI